MTTIVEKYHCIPLFFPNNNYSWHQLLFFLTNNYYFSCQQLCFPVTSLTSESNRLTRENQHLMSEASRHTQDFTNRPTPMPNMSGLYDMYGRESTNEADRLRKLYVSSFYHYVLFTPELKTESTILTTILFFPDKHLFFPDNNIIFAWQTFIFSLAIYFFPDNNEPDWNLFHFFSYFSLVSPT